MEARSLLALPPDALLLVFAACSTRDLCGHAMPTCRQLLHFAAQSGLWCSARLCGLGPGLLQRLEAQGAFQECTRLECKSASTMLKLKLPKLDALVLSGCSHTWTDLGMLWSGGSFSFSSLRTLRVQTLNREFVNTAKVWTSDACPLLEELCWSIKKDAMKNKGRRAAYAAFLKLLGKSLDKDFAKRRPRFRVSAYNGQPPPHSLRSWCSICKAELVRDETIFALGPGTQPHIDCEAFVWGSRPGELSREGQGAWTCPKRCHEQWDLFLVAGRGSGICICGFEYGLACGPRLAHLGPGRSVQRPEALGEATESASVNDDDASRWFLTFLEDPQSLRARPLALAALEM